MSEPEPVEHDALRRRRWISAILVLTLVVGLVAGLSILRATPELGWPDEWIYLTLARNIVERGTLNTNFYISSSIEALGYPHRDVHLPGYALALAALGPARGYTLRTAIELNVACFAITVLSAFVLAGRFLSPRRSVVAAVLVALLPPYAGYLGIAYPEHVVAAAMMILAAAAAWTEGAAAAFLIGFGLGVSLLFRETLIFVTPLLGWLLGVRRTTRFFLPGLVLALATILPPFSTQRAIHPNALYPSVVGEALKSPEPFTQLVSVIAANARINLGLLVTSNPFERAEDAVLVFLLSLTGVALLLSSRLDRRLRAFVRATSVSTALLFAAMVVVYVVRERGGVWGGVRALMPMAPLFVIGLCGLPVSQRLASGLTVSLVAASLWLSSWQIAFFNRYKGSNLEDQDRATRFIEERTRRFAPRRVVGGRYFQYGYKNFPAEVVWSGVSDMDELRRLYLKFPFDFVVIHRRSTLRFDLRKDHAYEWINAAEGQGAEYQIYRRVEP
jgi:hypothetical protein